MNHFASIAFVALAPVAMAQNVLFTENFNNGIPSTWTHLVFGVPIDPWSAGVSPATSSPDVFHEWFCMHGGITRDNSLVTRAIDLSGFTHADFRCVQHQMFPLQRSVNRVEVSTNGGLSFTSLYDETGTWSGPGIIQVNLDAYAGQPDVRIAFHYIGAVANEWRIDDVQVTTPQPVLDVSGMTAGGTAAYTCSGCDVGALALFGLSVSGAGPLPSPFGIVGLTPPIIVLAPQVADASGNAAVTLAIPTSAVGTVVHAQVLTFAPSNATELSNSKRATVQ